MYILLLCLINKNYFLPFHSKCLALCWFVATMAYKAFVTARYKSSLICFGWDGSLAVGRGFSPLSSGLNYVDEVDVSITGLYRSIDEYT